MLNWELQCQTWRERDAEEQAAIEAREAEAAREFVKRMEEADRETFLREARESCSNATHDDCPICDGTGYTEEQVDVDLSRTHTCSTCDGRGSFDAPCAGCELCDARAAELLAQWKAYERLMEYRAAVPIWAGEPVVQEDAMERARRRAPRKPIMAENGSGSNVLLEKGA